MKKSRTNYLRVYHSWCSELKETPSPDAEMQSDEILEKMIQELIQKHDTLPFEEKKRNNE